ncbi:MAG: 5-(carboxyamino)imidazole ribonucleotide mutase [Bdellovibrionales bacterium]|nr:5-(carboxyamino)imidazole ribonucleotide mutase [Bdellovibrionales bacterium]
MSSSKAQVAIIMGSDSDLPVLRPALEILQEFKVKAHVEVVSAHRTPEKMIRFAKQAQKNGFQVIIAGAGGAAHLPGMVASVTNLPVIGVPVKVGKINGLDSLLSIAQMPKGVPVATMAVDNSFNAGLLAVRILALKQTRLAKALDHYQNGLKVKVQKMNKGLASKLS